MKKRLFFTLALLLFAVSSYSQTDPNVPQNNTPMPLWKFYPKAFTQEPYGLDAITISVGAFDNYQVSTTNGFAETDIAVNPRNPLNFVASDNRITGFSGARLVYYTTDGGIVWNNSTLPSANQGDPAFSFDSLGNVYCASLNTNLSGLIIYKSTNGGASWTAIPVSTSGANQTDKEWIAADQTGGAFQNHVYIAHVNFTSGANVEFRRSTNNGSTWTLITTLGSGTPNPGPDVVVGPNGRVIVAWYSAGTVVRISTDGGSTFTSQVQASTHNGPGAPGGGGRFVLKSNIRVNGMPHIAVDMSSGARRGYIYNVYSANPPGPDAADVFCTRSTDGGLTWSNASPVRVNDDATFTDQWMPDVSVDNQGRVWAFWWDSRADDPGNLLTETWGAVSTDGGLTFTNFKIGSQNFNPNSISINQGDHSYLGDYQGIAGSTFTMPFYTGQNNTLQDFTAYLPDFGMTFNKSIDSIGQGGTSIVRMRNPVNGPYSGTVTYTTNITPSPAPGTLTPTFNPGNVRNFTGSPDSVLINVASTANVPLGLYTVQVTGTESAGPRVHVRSYQIRVVNTTGINIANSEIPTVFSLGQNYPNPFNPTTNIKFGLPKSTVVTLKVFDVLGREVASLLNSQSMLAGNYVFDFNAANIPSGVYFYKLITADFTDVKKMLMIK